MPRPYIDVNTIYLTICYVIYQILVSCVAFVKIFIRQPAVNQRDWIKFGLSSDSSPA